MTFAEVQDELREVSNEVLNLSKLIRTHSTDSYQLRLISVKLLSAQQRLEILAHVRND